MKETHGGARQGHLTRRPLAGQEKPFQVDRQGFVQRLFADFQKVPSEQHRVFQAVDFTKSLFSRPGQTDAFKGHPDFIQNGRIINGRGHFIIFVIGNFLNCTAQNFT